jgi:hypothetical protein
MIAQQGVFMLSDRVTTCHDVLSQLPPPAKKWTVGKLLIPASAKPEYIKRLSFMNINARSIYPGIDGLGQSIFEAITIRALTG